MGEFKVDWCDHWVAIGGWWILISLGQIWFGLISILHHYPGTKWGYSYGNVLADVNFTFWTSACSGHAAMSKKLNMITYFIDEYF